MITVKQCDVIDTQFGELLGSELGPSTLYKDECDTNFVGRFGDRQNLARRLYVWPKSTGSPLSGSVGHRDRVAVASSKRLG